MAFNKCLVIIITIIIPLIEVTGSLGPAGEQSDSFAYGPSQLHPVAN